MVMKTISSKLLREAESITPRYVVAADDGLSSPHARRNFVEFVAHELADAPRDVTPDALRNYAQRIRTAADEYERYAYLSIGTGSAWVVAYWGTLAELEAKVIIANNLAQRTFGDSEAAWLIPDSDPDLNAAFTDLEEAAEHGNMTLFYYHHAEHEEVDACRLDPNGLDQIMRGEYELRLYYCGNADCDALYEEHRQDYLDGTDLPSDTPLPGYEDYHRSREVK